MRLIGATEAATIANTSKQRIYQAVDRGDLKAELRKPLVLRLDEVERFAKLEKSKGGRPKKKGSEE